MNIGWIFFNVIFSLKYLVLNYNYYYYKLSFKLWFLGKCPLLPGFNFLRETSGMTVVNIMYVGVFYEYYFYAVS
jgi:hypothetical protein